MQLSLPTEARYVGMMRNVANCVMEDLGVPAEANSDVQLAVTEACANAVRHSDESEYQVRLEFGDYSCEVEVVDMGSDWTPAEIKQSDTDFESGRGLWLMQALVDDLEFERAHDGTHTRLRKSWGEIRLDDLESSVS
jgi:serine/threonine-protein kinase RsbW